MMKAILIDDELHCLTTLRILLTEYCTGVQIAEECPSANDGLKAIKKHKPDLVFLDIEMPVMNGFEMLEQLADIPFAIIFTTSYDQYAIKAIRFSALDYLLKPVDPYELKTAVKKVEELRHLPLAEQFQQLLRQVGGKSAWVTKIAIPTLEGFEMVSADLV